MRRLLMCATAVAATGAFAAYQFNYESVTGFEDIDADTAASSFDESVGITISAGDTESEDYAADASVVAEYQSAPSATAPVDAGEKYLALETGSDTLWRAVDQSANVYIDTLMQFSMSAKQPEDLDEDAKIAFWLDTSRRLNVIAGADKTNHVLVSDIDEETWYRLTVFAEESDGSLKFQILVDGTVLADAEGTTQFDSIVSGTTVSAVGFKGSGAVDDLAVAKRYPINNRYEHYFASGSGTEADPYLLADSNDLEGLAEIASGTALTTENVNFALSGDVDFAGKDAFPGIGVYSDAADGNAFRGVFDGKGHAIYNIKFTDRTYAGLFNQVAGGTVKDLTMGNASFVGEAEEYGGAFFVGNARPGTTLQGLTASGAFCADGDPATHNAAGIVCRANSNPNNPVNILNCVNNANIYGSYTKVAGILSIAQAKNKTEGAEGLVIYGCVNNGKIVRADSGKNVDGAGGVVGYATDYVKLMNCSSTGDVSAYKDGETVTDKVGSIVGYANANAVAASGVTTTLVDMPSVGGFNTGTATGLTYATIAENNGVSTATFVDFDFSGSVKLMANNGANELTPENGATLDFSVDTTLFPSAALTLNVPAGTTVNIESPVVASKIGGVTALKGEGRIVGNFYPDGGDPGDFTSLLQQETWAGTFGIRNYNFGGAAVSLSELGNANSSVCLDYGFIALTKDGNGIKALEVGTNGAYLTGDDGSGEINLPCAIIGSGRLNVQIANATSVLCTGDASAFAGNIAFGDDANACLIFGTGYDAGNVAAKRIVQGTDSTLTVASGKTWSSSNFMMHGNLTLNGKLVALDGTTPGAIWSNKGTAVITANTAGAFTFGNTDSWKGTYNVNYTLANNAAFQIPCMDGAKTVINGVDGAFGGYPTTGSAAPTVNGEVVLNADWTVANGWDNATTTFAKLSGSGNLTVDGTTSGTTGIPYAITLLDGYTGTLGGARGAFTIGTVNVAEAPEDGACVVKVALGDNGSIGGDLALTVNGEAAGTLVYRGDVEPAGLYVGSASGEAVEPGQTDGKTYETADAATAAAAAVTVAIPEAVAAGLTDAQKTDYLALFEAKAVQDGDGWKVEVGFTDEAAEELQDAVDGDIAEAIVAAAVADGAATIAAEPGLYYVLRAGTALTGENAPKVVECVLAAGDNLSGDGTITLDVPNDGPSGFYTVEISPVAVEVEAAGESGDEG